MKIKFKHYLHDSKDDFAWFMDRVLIEAGITDTDEREDIRQRMGTPFYEVTLECELDTESGEVTVLKTSL